MAVTCCLSLDYVIALKDSRQTESFNWQLDVIRIVQVFARGMNISDVHLYVKVTHCRFKFRVLILSQTMVNHYPALCNMTKDIFESFEFHSFTVKDEGKKAKCFLISNKSSVVSTV